MCAEAASMRTLALSFAVFFSFLPGIAGAGARPDLETVLQSSSKLHAYGAVSISPQGARLAFVRDGKLFVAQLPDGAPRAVEICAACDVGDFAWSPDGDRIAAIATARDGQAQLYGVATSGTAVRLTNVRGNLSNPRWSPAGDRIAFLFIKDAPRVPGPLNPAARQVGVIESDIYEQRIAVLPAGGGTPSFRSPADTYVYEFDWSPDGKHLAAIQAKGDGDNNWWLAQLAVIDASSGELRPLYKPPLQIANPRWSPDGRSIALIGGIMSDESVTGGDLYLVSAANGNVLNLTDGNRASISAFEWARHPDRIIATQIAGGSSAIIAIDPASKSLKDLWRGDFHIRATGFPFEVGSVAISEDGARFATIRESFSEPPAVVSAATGLGPWRMVDDPDANAPRWLGPAKSVTFKSGDQTVQGWLIAPLAATAGTAGPMIVVPHGGPAYASLPIFPQAPEAFVAAFTSQGYYVFEPNPRGSYGQGEAFTKANIRDFGGADFKDIMAGVDSVTASAPVDPKRVGIFGWSYGGFMTMWAVTQTQRFRAAVAGAGLSNWQSYYGENGIDTWAVPYMGASVYADPAAYAKMSPINFVTSAKTPTLVVVGERDAECPAPQSFEFWHALHDLGVTTQLVVYADEGHLFNKPSDGLDVTRRTVGWFDRYMP